MPIRAALFAAGTIGQSSSGGSVAVGPIAGITAPAGAVGIAPGESIQAKVDGNPNGTVIVLEAGVHRLQSVAPKAGNQFIGELGAIVSGARLLQTFTRQGNYWVASGQTQEGTVHGSCFPEFPRYDRPEDLFIDDKRLLHVASLAAVGPGKWFFDYAADKIYFADDPTGHKVETTVQRSAFSSKAANVVIKNIVVEKYACPAQFSAIQGEGNAWTIEHVEARSNHGVGLYVFDKGVARLNYVHNNGQMGVASTGADVLYEQNEIAFNNDNGADYGWEGGGSKFALTKNLEARCNFVHHNTGPGLWTDINNENTLYEKNIVSDNVQMGIFHEISYGAIIRDNIVLRNSVGWSPWLYGAQIQISTSQGVEVYGNVLEVAANGGNAIGILQQDRGQGLHGVYHGYNNNLHDNDITLLGASGMTGAVADWDEDTFWRDANNRMNGNHYHLQNTQDNPWAWNDTDYTWTQLQAAGLETTGTVDANVRANTTQLAVPTCN